MPIIDNLYNCLWHTVRIHVRNNVSVSAYFTGYAAIFDILQSSMSLTQSCVQYTDHQSRPRTFTAQDIAKVQEIL